MIEVARILAALSLLAVLLLGSGCSGRDEWSDGERFLLRDGQVACELIIGGWTGGPLKFGPMGPDLGSETRTDDGEPGFDVHVGLVDHELHLDVTVGSSSQSKVIPLSDLEGDTFKLEHDGQGDGDPSYRMTCWGQVTP